MTVDMAFLQLNTWDPLPYPLEGSIKAKAFTKGDFHSEVNVQVNSQKALRGSAEVSPLTEHQEA